MANTELSEGGGASAAPSPAEDHLLRARHSAAHLMAAAVLEMFPDAKLGVGPAIDTGFYYDFQLPRPLVEADLATIEERMRLLASRDESFVYSELGDDEARARFADQPFKLELIDAIRQGVTDPDGSEESNGASTVLSTYRVGAFEDLCRGPHVERTTAIPLDAMRLDRIAGAYWRGDEHRPMLQRVYGLLFDSRADLEQFDWQREEARRRDHRRIGEDLDLFTFSSEVGKGLPIWLPNGTIIRDELEAWARESERRAGYRRIVTPHLTREELYRISGHLPYFEEDLYAPIDIEGDRYYLRPMNCPHHHMAYKARPHSYRDLPLRYAEYGTVYRYERSGQLFGLMRTRGFTQNDAHIYCTEEQARDEFTAVMRMHDDYYRALGIHDFHMVLALSDPHRADKYHGDADMWARAEAISRDAMDASGIPYVEEIGGAAHYGPKVDFIIRSVVGREFASSTCQVDLYMPERFQLTFRAADGAEHLVVVLHRAPLGSHERFVAYLVEHFAGAFPVWLAPEQVRIVPITESQREVATHLHDRIFDAGYRPRVDDSDDRMQGKIRNAEMAKVPFIAVIGRREVEAGTVSLRVRGIGDVGAVSVEAFIAHLAALVRERSLEVTQPTVPA